MLIVRFAPGERAGVGKWVGPRADLDTAKDRKISAPVESPRSFAVVTIFWHETLCTPVELKPAFGGTYRLHLQGLNHLLDFTALIPEECNFHKHHREDLHLIYFQNFRVTEVR
jgi:hypothetical protein